MARRLFYLHGFASSPHSSKAAYLASRFAEHGIALECPDFNEPDFASLTLSRMLRQLDDALKGAAEPATLIGSSLGGTLAVLAAASFRHRIDRLVLLAPAVMFAKPGHHLLPPERVEQWRVAGALPFFHYAYGSERMLSFSFYEDSLQHDAFGAVFDQPTLIVQGLHDASVDPDTVKEFAAARRNVTLSLIDDDHQLLNSLPRIWDSIRSFVGIA
jgi:pimeloyl-ACP methyl ester carboxylesterase